MKIIPTVLFKLVQAEEGKVIYNKNDNSQMFKKLYIPLKVSDETILSTYQEVDSDDFQFVVAPEGTYTKLQIRRACRNLGIESKLDAVINSNQIFKKDWQDAMTIDLQDSVLTQALLNGNFTQEEIESIKDAIINGAGLMDIDDSVQEE